MTCTVSCILFSFYFVSIVRHLDIIILLRRIILRLDLERVRNNRPLAHLPLLCKTPVLRPQTVEPTLVRLLCKNTLTTALEMDAPRPFRLVLARLTDLLADDLEESLRPAATDCLCTRRPLVFNCDHANTIGHLARHRSVLDRRTSNVRACIGRDLQSDDHTPTLLTRILVADLRTACSALHLDLFVTEVS